jgi:hypothetical protein
MLLIFRLNQFVRLPVFTPVRKPAAACVYVAFAVEWVGGLVALEL